MRLEEIQTALFAAYDIRNSLDPEILARPHDDEDSDTFGFLLEIIIEELESLEKEMEGDEVDVPEELL
jgi:hypothetical protein